MEGKFRYRTKDVDTVSIPKDYKENKGHTGKGFKASKNDEGKWICARQSALNTTIPPTITIPVSKWQRNGAR
jgi:hypothetical protein